MTAPRQGLWLPARAKLNLVLRVVGRRDDGYHLLETLLHTIDLHDELWLCRVEGQGQVLLEMSGAAAHNRVGTGPDNLVVQAIERCREAAGVRDGFRARLHKRIPVGGGLGGGSSDAAAALRLCNALLGAVLPPAELQRIACALGADVPFLLQGGSQWGAGVGTELSPAVVEPMHFVLVVPPFDCPTAAVYKNHAPGWHDGRPQDIGGALPIPATREGVMRIGFRSWFSNDLRQAAEVVRPALAALRQRVADLGRLPVHLTGSGSTLFVACAREAAAVDCAARLRPLLAEGVQVVRTHSAGAVDDPRWTAWPGAGGPEPGEGVV